MGATAGAIRSGRAFVELFADDTKLQAGLKRAQVSLLSFSDFIRTLGLRSAGLGVVLSAPFAKATNDYAKFSDAMLVVGAVTSATERELNDITATARRLGQSTSFAAIQVAELMAELGRAGFASREVDRMTASVLNLARASQTDVAKAAQIVGSTLRQFDMGAASAANVTNILAKAANSSATSVDGIGQSLEYAGATSRQLGMSLERTVAIIGTLGNVGILGTEAGTAIRRLSSITAAEADRLKQIFGVAFKDAAGNALPLVESLEQINVATQKLGSADRLKKYNDAFAILGITSAIAVGRTAGSVRNLENQLLNVGDYAAQAAKRMDSEIGGSLRFLVSAFKDVELSLGKAIAPELVPIIQDLTKALKSLSTYATENPQTIVDMAKAAVGIAATGSALLGIGVAGGLAALNIRGIGYAIHAALMPMKLLSAGMGGVFSVMSKGERLAGGFARAMASKVRLPKIGGSSAVVSGKITKGDVGKSAEDVLRKRVRPKTDPVMKAAKSGITGGASQAMSGVKGLWQTFFPPLPELEPDDKAKANKKPKSSPAASVKTVLPGLRKVTATIAAGAVVSVFVTNWPGSSLAAASALPTTPPTSAPAVAEAVSSARHRIPVRHGNADLDEVNSDFSMEPESWEDVVKKKPGGSSLKPKLTRAEAAYKQALAEHGEESGVTQAARFKYEDAKEAYQAYAKKKSATTHVNAPWEAISDQKAKTPFEHAAERLEGNEGEFDPEGVADSKNRAVQAAKSLSHDKKMALLKTFEDQLAANPEMAASMGDEQRELYEHLQVIKKASRKNAAPEWKEKAGLTPPADAAVVAQAMRPVVATQSPTLAQRSLSTPASASVVRAALAPEPIPPLASANVIQRAVSKPERVSTRKRIAPLAISSPESAKVVSIATQNPAMKWQKPGSTKTDRLAKFLSQGTAEQKAEAERLLAEREQAQAIAESGTSQQKSRQGRRQRVSGGVFGGRKLFESKEKQAQRTQDAGRVERAISAAVALKTPVAVTPTPEGLAKPATSPDVAGGMGQQAQRLLWGQPIPAPSANVIPFTAPEKVAKAIAPVAVPPTQQPPSGMNRAARRKLEYDRITAEATKDVGDSTRGPGDYFQRKAESQAVASQDFGLSAGAKQATEESAQQDAIVAGQKLRAEQLKQNAKKVRYSNNLASAGNVVSSAVKPVVSPSPDYQMPPVVSPPDKPAPVSPMMAKLSPKPNIAAGMSAAADEGWKQQNAEAIAAEDAARADKKKKPAATRTPTEKAERPATERAKENCPCPTPQLDKIVAAVQSSDATLKRMLAAIAKVGQVKAETAARTRGERKRRTPTPLPILELADVAAPLPPVPNVSAPVLSWWQKLKAHVATIQTSVVPSGIKGKLSTAGFDNIVGVMSDFEAAAGKSFVAGVHTMSGDKTGGGTRKGAFNRRTTDIGLAPSATAEIGMHEMGHAVDLGAATSQRAKDFEANKAAEIAKVKADIEQAQRRLSIADRNVGLSRSDSFAGKQHRTEQSAAGFQLGKLKIALANLLRPGRLPPPAEYGKEYASESGVGLIGKISPILAKAFKSGPKTQQAMDADGIVHQAENAVREAKLKLNPKLAGTPEGKRNAAAYRMSKDKLSKAKESRDEFQKYESKPREVFARFFAKRSLPIQVALARDNVPTLRAQLAAGLKRPFQAGYRFVTQRGGNVFGKGYDFAASIASAMKLKVITLGSAVAARGMAAAMSVANVATAGWAATTRGAAAVQGVWRAAMTSSHAAIAGSNVALRLIQNTMSGLARTPKVFAAGVWAIEAAITGVSRTMAVAKMAMVGGGIAVRAAWFGAGAGLLAMKSAAVSAGPAVKRVFFAGLAGATKFVKAIPAMVTGLADVAIGAGRAGLALGRLVLLKGFAGLVSGVSLLLNPMTWLAVGAVAVVANWDKIKGAISGVAATGPGKLAGMWQRIKGDAMPTLLGIKDTAVTSFGAISEAIQAGDIPGAMAVMWSGLKAIYAEGMGYLRVKWFDLTTWATDAFNTIQQQAIGFGENVKQVLDLALFDWFGLRLSDVTKGFADAWGWIVSSATASANWIQETFAGMFGASSAGAIGFTDILFHGLESIRKKFAQVLLAGYKVVSFMADLDMTGMTAKLLGTSSFNLKDALAALDDQFQERANKRTQLKANINKGTDPETAARIKAAQEKIAALEAERIDLDAKRGAEREKLVAAKDKELAKEKELLEATIKQTQEKRKQREEADAAANQVPSGEPTPPPPPPKKAEMPAGLSRREQQSWVIKQQIEARKEFFAQKKAVLQAKIAGRGGNPSVAMPSSATPNAVKLSATAAPAMPPVGPADRNPSFAKDSRSNPRVSPPDKKPVRGPMADWSDPALIRKATIATEIKKQQDDLAKQRAKTKMLKERQEQGLGPEFVDDATEAKRDEALRFAQRQQDYEKSLKGTGILASSIEGKLRPFTEAILRASGGLLDLNAVAKKALPKPATPLAPSPKGPLFFDAIEETTRRMDLDGAFQKRNKADVSNPAVALAKQRQDISAASGFTKTQAVLDRLKNTPAKSLSERAKEVLAKIKPKSEADAEKDKQLAQAKIQAAKNRAAEKAKAITERMLAGQPSGSNLDQVRMELKSRVPNLQAQRMQPPNAKSRSDLSADGKLRLDQSAVTAKLDATNAALALVVWTLKNMKLPPMGP